MKTREEELKELREQEERSQKWVYGIMAVCLALTFLFMILDARANGVDDFIVIEDDKIKRCFVDYMGNVICS